MNLDELRSVQAKERRKDSLQHLRDSFYDDVAAYIADLRAARDRRAAQVDNPFGDDDVRRMSDEIETAEEVAEALYERRVGKVVKLASFAAADMSVETEGMTSQERELFDDLVDRITENKTAVLDVLAGESTTNDVPVATDAATTNDAPVATDAATTDDADGADASDPPTRSNEPRPHPSEPDTESAGALSSAMGPTDDDGNRPAEEATEHAAESPTDPTSGSDTDPTPVDPEPAPPGAVGGGEELDESGGVDDAANRGTTTADGGQVTEPPTPEAASGPSPGTHPDSPTRTDARNRSSPDDTDRATVRITRDVGPILGVDDREYDLASEDVVTLPTANAEPLVDRDAAERLD